VVLTDFGKIAEKLPHSWKQMFVSRPRGFLLSLIRLLHLFTFSIIYGSALWVTFVSGLILSNNLPQQQFSFMQSRIFPIYLRLLAAGELLLTMLHSLLHPWFSADKLETWQLQNFVWILVATLINLLVFEPWETKVTNCCAPLLHESNLLTISYCGEGLLLFKIVSKQLPMVRARSQYLKIEVILSSLSCKES
jgi:hypothetical protein